MMRDAEDHGIKVGQLFIVGYAGATPPRPFLKFLEEEQIGGVILFEENCTDRGQLIESMAAIRNCYPGGPSPFMAIDQEGGRVCRLRGAPYEYRSAAEYAELDDLDLFEEEYSRAAVALESLGFNVNFAPVADALLNPLNTCLKGRCYGSLPERAADFVARSVEISRRCGLLSCLKHFPGLGAAGTDPHKKTASVDYDEVMWEQREALPFRAGVAAGTDMVMTTHMALPHIDSKIATVSAKIVSDMLRRHLPFGGLIVTDDLTMGGADTIGEIGPRTVAAFNAGHDLLLFGRDHSTSMRAYDYFRDAMERGEIGKDRIRQSLGRLSGAKFKLDASVLK